MSITQRTLSVIKPTGSVQFIRDDKLIGFGIKVTAKGKASYIVESRVKSGRVIRKTIGNIDHMSLDDARSEARGLLHRMKQGVDISKERPTEPIQPGSLSEAFDRYLTTRVRLKDTTQHDYRKIMSNCFSDLLPIPTDQITLEDIARKYRELKDRSSEAYSLKALRTLKAVLNSTGLVVNPVSQFLRSSGVSSIPKARTRYLEADEIVEILSAATQAHLTHHPGHGHFVFCQLLSFYFCTGLRKNEALSLTKADCEGGVIKITNTKSGRDHELPLVGSVKSIVQKRIKTSSTDRLWAYTDSGFRTQLEKTKKILNFKEPWTIHDLRRTFAEHCALVGVDQNVISACLNHAPIGVTQRNYLGGGLARKAMITEVYEKLEHQFLGYYFGMEEVRLKPGETWVSRISGDR